MREIAALYYLIAAICTLGLVSVSMRPSKESRGSLLAGLLLATGPLAQLALFADPFAYVRGDFAQHAAYAAQYADGLRHFELPRIVHSSAIVGDIEPLYYGRLLYLWSGALSTVFGGLMAMKLAGLIVLTIQIAACYRVFLALRVAPVAAACLAVISSVTVYQFNNAIIRGGITEFIATSLLFVAACQMLLLFIRGDRPILRGVAFGLTWGLVTQTHPITALNGSVALGIIGAYLTLYSRQWRLAAGFGVIAAVVIILIAAPWLYINLAEPSSYSNSGNTLPAFKLKHWAAIDDFWLRLSPLPWYRAQADFRESYFVTQCNSVLLLAYFGIVVSRVRRLWPSIFFIVVALIYLIVSTSTILDFAMPRLLAVTQFAYRLVTYVNLFLFVACAAALMPAETDAPPRQFKLAMPLLLVTLAGAAINAVAARDLVTWYQHPWIGPASQARIFGFLRPHPSHEDLAVYSWSWGCFFGQSPAAAENITSYCDTRDRVLKFLMGRSATEGPPPLINPASSPGPFTTNVVYHSWNTITVNGKPCVCIANRRFAAIGNPGPALVRYEFRPDRIWRTLDFASIATVLVALLILLGTRLRLAAIAGRKA